MAGREDDSCSVCDGEDYRKCGCPWGKPFSDWPNHLRNALDARLKGNSRDGK